MSSASEKKLTALLEKEQQLKKQIASERAKVSANERKNETRRKILVGSYFIDTFKTKQEELKKIMDNYLTRPDDRKLFGLGETKPAPSTNKPDDKPQAG